MLFERALLGHLVDGSVLHQPRHCGAEGRDAARLEEKSEKGTHHSPPRFRALRSTGRSQ